MPVRPRFDPKRPLSAARDFTFAGRAYRTGDPFPHPDDPAVAQRILERQYEARAVNMGDAVEPPPEPVQMEPGPKNGYYTITAPWLEKPLVARGRVNAEKTFAKIKDEGAPLGWIEGGSEVTIEESGGGWYAISAPWLNEPEKVQGRDTAEQRQREIHDAGAPAQNEDDGEGSPAKTDDSAEEGEKDDTNKSESEQGGEAGDGAAEGASPPDPARDTATAGSEAGSNTGAGTPDADPASA